VIRRATAGAALLLTTACVSLPPAGDAGSWPARRAALQSLHSWTLTGRIAVASGSEGFSGGLAWRQDGARSEIELRSPLGGTALSIRVDDPDFSVTDERGAALDGEAARELLAAELGAPLPVGALRYWLVGAPAPGVDHRESIGSDGRLASLEQAGWQVRYARYEAVGGLALPARLELESGGVRLRLVAASWQLTP